MESQTAMNEKAITKWKRKRRRTYCSATSPREVEKVERSSCANCENTSEAETRKDNC